MRTLFRLISSNSLKSRLSSKPTQSVELFVNDKPVTVPQGSSVLQACAMAGVDIPRFCYHERLSIAGNCRMCLVEVEKSPKPIASCAMPASPGMRVLTNSQVTKQARESVMEFILANHPLDCPICDQAGECDLQDQSMAFGTDRSRMIDTKRAVEDKDIGPLVRTIMTRCIQCTRCVRFASEIAGVDDLGTTGRGADIQIGTFVSKILASELSGNIIDICPVGALTSKPYTFKARPWELRRIESIDVMDAVGSSITVCTRSDHVQRILPRLNEEINEEWLGDKARFAHDGLQYQRLVTPLIRGSPKDDLVPSDWPNSLGKIANKLNSSKYDQMAVLTGRFADLETLAVLKDLFHRLDCENLFTEESFPASTDFREPYCLNAGIQSLEEADLVLIVGFNPRLEAPLLNCRIRKGWRNGDTRVFLAGTKVDLSYDYDYLGEYMSVLDDIASGEHPLALKIKNARMPLVLLGSSALQHNAQVAEKLHSCCLKIASLSKTHSKGFNIVHQHASQVGGLDLGYKGGLGLTELKDLKLLFLCGADEGKITRDQLADDCLVVYLGSHGDRGAAIADVVLPGAAYTEKTATFVNTEGRYQQCQMAVSPPGDARDDWQVVRALAEVAGVDLPYETLAGLRQRISEILPGIDHIDYRQETTLFHSTVSQLGGSVGPSSPVEKVPETGMTRLSDYFMTDSISRNSVTMSKCVLSHRENEKNTAKLSFGC